MTVNVPPFITSIPVPDSKDLTTPGSIVNTKKIYNHVTIYPNAPMAIKSENYYQVGHITVVTGQLAFFAERYSARFLGFDGA